MGRVEYRRRLSRASAEPHSTQLPIRPPIHVRPSPFPLHEPEITGDGRKDIARGLRIESGIGLERGHLARHDVAAELQRADVLLVGAVETGCEGERARRVNSGLVRPTIRATRHRRPGIHFRDLETTGRNAGNESDVTGRTTHRFPDDDAIRFDHLRIGPSDPAFGGGILDPAPRVPVPVKTGRGRDIVEFLGATVGTPTPVEVVGGERCARGEYGSRDEAAED